MLSLVEYIDSISPLDNITKDKIHPLFIKRSLPKGHMLVRQGHVATDLYFLESGIIRTFYKTTSGQEYNKAFDQPPSLTCGYTSLITGKQSKISLETLVPSVVWIADYKVFYTLYNMHPDLERVARIVAERSFVEKEERELDMALLSALERYIKFKVQFPGMEQKISQYHIASYLGITPTQLSRIRKELKNTKP